MAGQQRICLECEQAFIPRRATQGYCLPACPKASHRGVFTSTRRVALARDDYQCQKCRAAAGLEVHHIQPRSQGGSHNLDNLQMLYRAHH